MPSDRTDHRRGAVIDYDALASLEAVLPGKIARVTRSENGVSIIVHRPLSPEDTATVLKIVPGASIAL